MARLPEPGFFMDELMELLFVPVVGRQDHAPDVDGLVEFDAVVGWVLGVDVNDPSAALLSGEINVNHDLHPRFQFVRTGDKSAVKVDHDGFAGAGERFGFTQDFERNLKRHARTATRFGK